jgi:hypothetical protein
VEGRRAVRLEMAAGDPLLGAPCLLCGERFEAEGYGGGFRPEILPGVAAEGFAPGIYAAGAGSGLRLAGFVCPACYGDGGSDLALGLRAGAKRLKELAKALERGVW